MSREIAGLLVERPPSQILLRRGLRNGLLARSDRTASFIFRFACCLFTTCRALPLIAGQTRWFRYSGQAVQRAPTAFPLQSR